MVTYKLSVFTSLRDMFLIGRSHNPFNIILALHLMLFGLHVTQLW
jgi:hypothetical protein